MSKNQAMNPSGIDIQMATCGNILAVFSAHTPQHAPRMTQAALRERLAPLIP